MKKILIALILVLCLAAAANAEGLIRLTVNGTNVNLRSGPGKSSPVVGRADMPEVFIAQDRATVDAKDNMLWYRLAFCVDKGGNLYDVRQRTKDGSFPFISAKFVKVSAAKPSDVARARDLRAKMGPGSTPQGKHQTVHVNDAKSFLAALASDTTIILPPGVFNLSKCAPPAQPDSRLRDGVKWSSVTDGHELTLTGFNNLTIRGGAGGATKIISDPRNAFVLRFESCTNIAIEDVTAGHSKGGDAEHLAAVYEGGVFIFSGCRDINIKNTNMNGCNTVGLILGNTKNVKVTGSSIYECSDIMVMDECQNIAFKDCAFRDNRRFTLVTVSKSKNVRLAHCKFLNNSGKMFDVESPTEVKLDGCTFRGNTGDDGPIGSNSKNVVFTNCTFD